MISIGSYSKLGLVNGTFDNNSGNALTCTDRVNFSIYLANFQNYELGNSGQILRISLLVSGNLSFISFINITGISKGILFEINNCLSFIEMNVS